MIVYKGFLIEWYWHIDKEKLNVVCTFDSPDIDEPIKLESVYPAKAFDTGYVTLISGYAVQEGKGMIDSYIANQV